MNSDTEVKVLDLATLGDLSNALQNFAADGSDITARFLSYLETQVSDMEEVYSMLYARMQEAESQLDDARSAEYSAKSALSYCESQVYEKEYIDEEGNSQSYTIYPDCSSELSYLSRCEDAMFDSMKRYEAAKELYADGKNLLLASQECVSNFQAFLSYQFHPLLNNNTPNACRKLSSIAAELYGYLDTRFGGQIMSSNSVSNAQQTFFQTAQTPNLQTTEPTPISHQSSKPVLQEDNDKFNLFFQDKLGRNVEANWDYKEGQLVAFKSLTCNSKNVLQYPSAVQFTVNLDKIFDFKKGIEVVKNRILHINTIYLLDEFQNFGIGSEIVRQLEVLALSKGCSSMNVFAENASSLALFKKAGFELDTSIPGCNMSKNILN